VVLKLLKLIIKVLRDPLKCVLYLIDPDLIIKQRHESLFLFLFSSCRLELDKLMNLCELAIHLFQVIFKHLRDHVDVFLAFFNKFFQFVFKFI